MLICTEGLIGLGKTTLCQSLGIDALYEPVEDNPFLSLYYADPKRWAYAMQVNLLTERFIRFQHAQWMSAFGKDVVVDRSFYGDYAFALVQQQDGYFTEAEFNSYRKMHMIHQKYLQFPDITLRLRASIDTTMERISKRGRGCEEGIPRAYLESLDAAYATLFEDLKHKCCVVDIDAEQDAESVLRDAKFAIEQRRIELEARSHEYPHYKECSL